MPQISVTVLEGRTDEEIADLGRALTDAAARALGVGREAVRVTVTTCPPSRWFVAGESMAELRASGRR